MIKLDEKKIQWIIREKGKGELSTTQIAKILNVSRRRVLQLWAEYRKTGKMPVIKKPGRPKKHLSLSHSNSTYYPFTISKNAQR